MNISMNWKMKILFANKPFLLNLSLSIYLVHKSFFFIRDKVDLTQPNPNTFEIK